jgi:hypothetical protein
MNKYQEGEQQKVIDIFRKFAQENPNIYFINYNKDYEHQHDLFFDPRHLNYKGKEIITSRLRDDIRHLFKTLLPHMTLPATI